MCMGLAGPQSMQGTATAPYVGGESGRAALGSLGWRAAVWRDVVGFLQDAQSMAHVFPGRGV